MVKLPMFVTIKMQYSSIKKGPYAHHPAVSDFQSYSSYRTSFLVGNIHMNKQAAPKFGCIHNPIELTHVEETENNRLVHYLKRNVEIMSKFTKSLLNRIIS